MSIAENVAHGDQHHSQHLALRRANHNAFDNPYLAQLDEIWLIDFEYGLTSAGHPDPVCLVAWELRTERKLRLWRDEFGSQPPYAIDENSLVVAYFASAEAGCHVELGWKCPARLLDLFTEFRNLTNGRKTVAGNSLLGALAQFGLDGIQAAEKDNMRQLVLSGGPWSESEKQQILDYCESDVEALAKLLRAMLPSLDVPRALLRGRYMSAVARIERNGVPLDCGTLSLLKKHWVSMQDRLIADVDKDFGIYDGRTFKHDRFAAWLSANGIAWPHLPSGRLDLTDDTFRDMARARPSIAPLQELRCTLSRMRLAALAVGDDGRNRTMLSPFRSKTGRNQPSNTEFIFGPSVWLRGLIKPPEGYAVAYLDWEQQEFGIAAALSGDCAMQTAYQSGDPYLEFGKQAGAIPQDGTKSSHKAERDQFKQCVLAVQYGMGAESLALRLGQPTWRARQLLDLHHQTYHRFWEWSDASLDFAMLTSALPTVFGWTLNIGDSPNQRSVRNFPMQANGAEMLRLACCIATEEGVEICAPVHDAVLILARIDQIDAAVNRMQAIMAEASRLVLGGFELRSDANLIRYPDRYMDERGKVMWDAIMRILADLEGCGG